MDANGNLHPGIRVDHIEVEGGAVGLIFVASTIYTFFVGIPALRWFLVGAIVLGTVISLALYFFHKHAPKRIPGLRSFGLNAK